VAGPGVSIQAAEVRDDLCAQRIGVGVVDEFKEVGIFLHDNGLVALLEQVADLLMPPV